VVLLQQHGSQMGSHACDNKGPRDPASATLEARDVDETFLRLMPIGRPQEASGAGGFPLVQYSET